jgi:predicted nucleic acid-binding protein
MRLFLDTNVLLAAAGSATGASREIMKLARPNGWHLVVTPYVLQEVRKNLAKIPDATSAAAIWRQIEPELLVMNDVLTLREIAVFSVAKDRPVLFGAFAWADILLTLDHADFVARLGTAFYGMPIMTPGGFVRRERVSGRLVNP